jgi:hypothetical protein
MRLHEMLLGGPGLDGYTFNADVYCVDCSKGLIENLFAVHLGDSLYMENPTAPAEEQSMIDYLARDSEVMPQPIFFGESDHAQYCADCSEYLYGKDGDA